MKRLAFVVVVLAFGLFPGSSKANDLKTGFDLYNTCKIVRVQHPSELEMVDGIYCAAYLRGLTHTLRLWRLENEKNDGVMPPPACVPESVTGRQLSTVLLDYLDANPKWMREESLTAALRAFQIEYPCKVKGRTPKQ